MLDLFPVLFEITLFLGSFRLFDPRGFVDEAGSDTFHVDVGLDHLRVIVAGAGEGDVGLFTELARSVNDREGLLVTARRKNCYMSDCYGLSPSLRH